MSARGKAGALAAPVRPQVNLLPPEVRSKRALSVAKRWMAITVVLSLLAALGLVAYATLEVRTAEKELATAQAETIALLKEQAEYADVPVILGSLADAEDAQVIAMETDILWQPFLDALAAVAPQPVSFEEIGVTAPSPMVPLEPATNVLDYLVEDRVAEVRVVGRATEMPDTADWMRAMESIPGLSDVYFYSAPVVEKEELIFYEFTVTAQVRESALSNRWADADDEAAADEEGE